MGRALPSTLAAAALLAAAVWLALGPETTPSKDGDPPEASESTADEAATEDGTPPGPEPPPSGRAERSPGSKAAGEKASPAGAVSRGSPDSDRVRSRDGSDPRRATERDSGLSPAQLEWIRQRTRRDLEGLEPRIEADGTVHLDYEGRFQHVPVARVDEDGTVTIEAH